MREVLLALLCGAALLPQARGCLGNIELSGLRQIVPAAQGVYSREAGAGFGGRPIYRQVPADDRAGAPPPPRFIFFVRHQWAVGATPGAAPYELAVHSNAATPDEAARGAGKVWVAFNSGAPRPALTLRARCIGASDAVAAGAATKVPPARAARAAAAAAAAVVVAAAAAPPRRAAGPCAFVQLHLGFGDVEGVGDSITRDSAAPALVRCGGYYSLQRARLPRLVYRQLYFPFCHLYEEPEQHGGGGSAGTRGGSGGKWVVSKALWKPPQLLVAPHAPAGSPDRVAAGGWQALDRRTVLYRPAPSVTVGCAPTPAPTPAPATPPPTPPPTPDGTLLPPPPALPAPAAGTAAGQAALVHCVSACRRDEAAYGACVLRCAALSGGSGGGGGGGGGGSGAALLSAAAWSRAVERRAARGAAEAEGLASRHPGLAVLLGVWCFGACLMLAGYRDPRLAGAQGAPPEPETELTSCRPAAGWGGNETSDRRPDAEVEYDDPTLRAF